MRHRRCQFGSEAPDFLQSDGGQFSQESSDFWLRLCVLSSARRWGAGASIGGPRARFLSEQVETGRDAVVHNVLCLSCSHHLTSTPRLLFCMCFPVRPFFSRLALLGFLFLRMFLILISCLSFISPSTLLSLPFASRPFLRLFLHRQGVNTVKVERPRIIKRTEKNR